MEPATLTITRSSDYSGLSRSTIYNKIRDGELEVRRIGRRTLVTRRSLDRLLGIDTAEPLAA